jgi:hypothetical protein
MLADLPPTAQAEVRRAQPAVRTWLDEPDPARLLGVRRSGAGSKAAYKRHLNHDPCAYCGRPAPVGEYGGHEIDQHERHRDGLDHWTNYAPACRFCNVAKLDMVLGASWRWCDLRRGTVPPWGSGPR